MRLRPPRLDARLHLVVLAAAVGAVGFAVRLEVLRRNGWLSVGTYDDGVYFSSAVALLHGRLPYRDVLFLQPPGVLVALSPFAALADLVGDARAFAAARIAFCGLGGLDAALVVLLLRRSGATAAAAGGALFALFFPAVYVARTLLLEPLGTTAVLLALLAAQRAPAGRPRWWVVAGALAGLGAGVKIWGVAAALVVLLFARGGRLRFALGAVCAVLVVYLPFFLASPAAMWQQVVAAQLGRAASTNGPDRRIEVLLGVEMPDSAGSPLRGVSASDLATLLVLGVVGAAIAALVDRRTRVLVALLAVDTAVLLASPSFFQQYAGLTAAPLALVVGAGLGVLLRRVDGVLPRAVVAVLVVAVVAGLSQGRVQQRDAERPPIAALRRDVAGVDGCIVADDPSILLVLNRLSGQLDRGCAFQPDLSGHGYVLALRTHVPDRYDDPAFQRLAVRTLRSGSAYFRIRGAGLELDPASLAALDRDPVIAGHGRWALRASPG